METNFKIDVILSVYSENAAQLVITTWGWRNRTSIACYVSSKLFKFKESNAKYFTCKKITYNPCMVSKHRVAYKLVVIIQQICYSTSWDL